MTAPDLLSVGRVARAHGLRGELRVEPFFSGSSALEEATAIYLSRGDEPPVAHELEWARPVPKAFLVKLKTVNDRTAAEGLAGSTVRVLRSELEEPDASEFYLVDLIGARVVGPEGEVGVVVEVALHPSVDALVVRLPDGKLLEQPLGDHWIARVSVEDKLVELATLDGLIG